MGGFMDNNSKTGCLIIFIIAVLLLKGCSSIMNEPTQYEKDYKSSRNKTWDEMTPGEKKVTRDEIEWYLKKQNK